MAGTLTRSRIEAFDQTANQLSQYASQWRAAASDLDRAADSYVSEVANPSGTQWQGQASAAALDTAHTDRVSVTGAVMHAHAMADVAEQGSSSLLGARQGALEAIQQAEADDFTVGEDLSVADNHTHTDPATYVARMSQAEAHLGYIEHQAGLLEAENQRVATQLGAGASQMSGMVPATWKTKGGGSGKPQIQLVDNHRGSGADQATVNDPHADPTAKRLAQERLDDLRNSNLVGPPVPDPVLGGDTKTRAQARRQFQEFLESGKAYPDRPPLTPDQATQLIDKWEFNSRNMILNDFGKQLQAAGVSPPGVERAIGEIRGGKTPGQVLHDATSGLSDYGGALGGGAESHGAAVPRGQHWAPNVPVWSESDAKALEGFGRHLTKAGIGLDALVTGYDVASGAPLGPAAAGLGARAAGGFAGGWAAGSLWGSLVGPEGTLIVGFLGGVAGAAGADKLVQTALGG
ncbi:MAG: hypothetical protein J2P17_18535 [Mycobacterium sp.]|nr:hypothetical protein [Mycobacterium sp.]